MNVELTPAEQIYAAQVGVMRRITSLRKARPGSYGRGQEDAWGSDIEAAGAELAVAKYVGSYWTGGAFLAPQSEAEADVGDWIEVRHTLRDDGCLIVHGEDSDKAVYTLVTGSMPIYRVRGAVLGQTAKQAKFWRDEGVRFPAFFVPQEALGSPRILRGITDAIADQDKEAAKR